MKVNVWIAANTAIATASLSMRALGTIITYSTCEVGRREGMALLAFAFEMALTLRHFGRAKFSRQSAYMPGQFARS